MPMNSEPEPDTQHKRLGRGMIYLMWMLVIGMLTLFFNTVLERQHNPNRTAVTQIQADGAREVVLQRNRYGHYVATGLINGEKTVFMLDTGASDVAVPERVAKRLQLKRGPEVLYWTANGRAIAYATVLESVSLGEIVLNDVRASINPNMDGDEVLLGMTFLKYLEFTQQGDRLTLRQGPSPDAFKARSP